MGQTIQNFVVQYLVKNTKEQLKELAESLVMVQEGDKPSEDEIKDLGKYYDSGVNGGSLEDYYALLRDTQGNPWCYVEDSELKVMIDGKGFLRDSLFCEWAYIINLDENVLEIYKGFVKSAPVNSRYYDKEKTNRRGGYFPVELDETIPFETLNEFNMGKYEESFND